MKTNSAFTLHNDCLPQYQALSRDQASLIDHLQQISNSSFVDPLFFENLVRSLVLFGNCKGLAHTCRDGGGTVLCRWLRSEISLSFDTRQQESHIRKQLLIMADHIDFALLALRKDPRWQLLFEAPQPSRNRLIHFQLAISGSPAYQLVAAKLHRGICAKTIQLRNLDTALFNDRLGGFVQPLVRIARNIPADSVRKSLLEYPEGEFDDLVEEVINTLPRKEVSPDGRSTYASKTLRKFSSGWVAAFYGKASERAFIQHKYRAQRASRIDPRDPARADELSESHPLREIFLKLVDQQNCRESVDLGITKSRATSPKAPRKIRGAGMGKISKGKAAALFMPTSTMPGVLSITAIAMIMEGMGRIAEFVSELESSAARILIDLMLHTGRRPEWLLSLQVGDFPNSVWETMQPRWPVDSRVICHVPEIYACPPTPAVGEFTEWANYKIDDGATVNERINRIHQVPIPQQTACLMSTFLMTRNQVIDSNPEATVRLKCSHNSGLFFIVERNQDLVPLSEAWVDILLETLTAHLQGYIPSHQTLRATNFSRSFEGLYASLGLCGVFRYYISGRAGRAYEMPLRYSRVDLKDIDAEYSRAYAGLNEMISAEAQKLFGETRWKLSPEDPVSAIELQQPGEAFFGSTRVPSLAILREIIGSLRADVDQVELRSQNEPGIDALTRLLAVALGLLNGLRPFEVTRLTRRSFDLNSSTIAVKGKASWGKQVYRSLPLTPGVVNLVDELLNLLGQDLAPGKRIFSVYQEESGRWKPMSTKDLDQILESAAIAAGWSSGPIFYGLRHRFRSDLLSFGMDEQYINYLMGHGIIGQEAFSIYSEQRYENLREQYLEAAAEMARCYGFR